MNDGKILKVGDIVYVPCQVVATATLAGRWSPADAEDNIVDLMPICAESGTPYNTPQVKQFTIYIDDVLTISGIQKVIKEYINDN